MSIDPGTSVRGRAITAFFDTAGAAKKAVDDLVDAGIPRQHITQTEGHTAGEEVTTTATAGEHKGFWESLKDLFLPDEDRAGYAEGLRRGGYLLSVQVDEANYTRALDLLDTDGAVNLDERQAQWRNEGWDGSQGASGRTAGTAAAATGGPTVPARASDDPGPNAPISGSASNYAADAAARAAALGLSDADRARIGQRDLSHGRTRLRSYAFGAPVSGVDASRITAHMEVISADGQTIGRVDHLEGPDRIKLTRTDSPDHQHHIVPFTWIDHIDQHVHLKRTLAEIKADPTTHPA